MFYTAYGLRIQSELSLPDLLMAPPGEPDVSIHYGPVPDAFPHPRGSGGAYQAIPGAFLLMVPGIARYLVRDGREICIDPAPSGTENEVRIFMLGSAMGALLHQRQRLVLHASAMQTDLGAVLFAGHSGAGKSTLLAAMLKRGYRMLADDITVVQFGADGVPVAIPGYPCTRLWADAAAKLDHPTELLRRVREPLDKYLLPVHQFCAEALPLRAIFALGIHNETDIRVESLEPMDGFQVLAFHTYRRRFVDALGVGQPHFRLVSAVAKEVPLTRITRPTSPFLLQPLVDCIEAQLMGGINST